MKDGAFGCKNIGDCEQLVSDMNNPNYFRNNLDMFISEGKAITFDAGERVELTDTESGDYPKFHTTEKTIGFIMTTSSGECIVILYALACSLFLRSKIYSKSVM